MKETRALGYNSGMNNIALRLNDKFNEGWTIQSITATPARGDVEYLIIIEREE